MIDLGKRIRKERQAKGWSLKKLSGLIGVSIMTLQRIETGKVSPSVDLLVEISYQLGLAVTEFVSDKERALIHLTAADLPSENPVEGFTKKCLFPDGLVAEGLSVWLAGLTEGTTSDRPPVHRFEGGYLLEGSTEIEFDDHKIRQQAGETVYFDARFRQGLKSTTGAKAIIVYKD